MRMINRLKPPGVIQSVRLDQELVVVRTFDGEIFTYRRIENEDVGMQEGNLRRGTLPTEI